MKIESGIPIPLKPRRHGGGNEIAKTDGRDLLTHSRMASYKKCPRAHFYAYELGIRKDNRGAPLRVGGNVHEALEALGLGELLEDVLASVDEVYSGPPEWADVYDWLVECVTVKTLIEAYCAKWTGDGIEIIATEQAFELDLLNPDTGFPSKLFRLAGKIDKIVKLADGRLAVLEHKTTGDSIGSDSDYWPRLRLDHQISLYMHAARRLGHDVQTVLYDVIHKPDIAPWKATPLEKRKYRQDGGLYGNQRSVDETPEEFGMRLKADIANRPDFYFSRREIPRLDSDLREFEQELWMQAQIIRQHQIKGAWFRNTNACIHPFKCEFADICFGGLKPELQIPQGFVKIEYVHQELLK